ncbi:copper chaperone PCu(A)C [Ramlibacter sp. XY19]|uniref:copper chaperone PCu(A)C n=1 Tax=Ramlibacter paludis TaxID=2908000 RepID=UPI0023DCDF94|nr:copper chaperone PCu(A)C [Ramlibacter paludis]MCG2594840.1 copper chaperone PCu(A)C [Ramlibacter paludis]
MHKLMASLSFAAAAVVAQAQTAPAIAVDGAWARAALQGQPTSAGYMTLTAKEPLTLVGASSPAAGVVELHEMKLDGDVMRMRAVDQLPLPAGKAVELKPGGYHFMLMELKAQFKPGLVVPLTLRLKDAKGVERTQQVALPVSAAAPLQHKH